MEQPSRPTLFDFHGVSMTKYFTDNWDNVQNFRARPDDIVIATYPKAGEVFKGTTILCGIFGILFCFSFVFSFQLLSTNWMLFFLNFQGTTWVSYILDLLYFSQVSPERQDKVPLHDRVPFLEMHLPGSYSGKFVYVKDLDDTWSGEK